MREVQEQIGQNKKKIAIGLHPFSYLRLNDLLPVILRNSMDHALKDRWVRPLGMVLVPSEFLAIFGPVMDKLSVAALMHPCRVHFENGGKAGLDKEETANIKAEPIARDDYRLGLERLDLAAAGKDVGIEIRPVAKIEDGSWSSRKRRRRRRGRYGH